MKPLILTLVVALSTAAVVKGQRSSASIHLPLRLTGALISGGGVGNLIGTGRIEITITRWSTPEERTLFTEALTSQGEAALLDELIKAKPVGTVRFNTQLAYDLRYASETPHAEGGTRVFFATDRPVSAWEIWNNPQYARYPFTLIDLTLDRHGEGTGSLLLAARVTAGSDGQFLSVENFATQPIAITQLRVVH
jgi:hypothetical protein